MGVSITDQAMQRWREQGFRPELVRSADGRWAVQFHPDGPVPAWADWNDGLLWHDSEDDAIKAALLDEQSETGYRLAGKSTT